MRSFWKRSRPESLEDRLRSNRPEPRTEFLRNMTTHIREQAPTAAPAFRHRAALAVAMTAALLIAAAVLGGVGYASTATTHAAHAITHVFAAASTRDSNATASHSSATGAGSKDTKSGPDNSSRGNGENGKGTDKGGNDQGGNDGGGNPAHHEYEENVIICITTDSGKHVTLSVPRNEAQQLVAQGRATLGACKVEPTNVIICITTDSGRHVTVEVSRKQADELVAERRATLGACQEGKK